MSDAVSFGTIHDTGEPCASPKPDSRFRIGVLADFSGRQNRDITEASEAIAERRLLRIDRDTFDDVLAKLAVQLVLPVGEDGDQVTLSFASLDDFHPDQLHDRIEKIADAYDSDEKSALMNSVLHHPDFQALESAWRGVYWLLGRATKGGLVEVLLVDISLAELSADLNAAEELNASGLYQLLIEKGIRGSRAESWGAFVAGHVFNNSVEHAQLLGRLVQVTSQANAPVLGTLDPGICAQDYEPDSETVSAWQELRKLRASHWLGLSMPRFLLRLPYGENSQAISRFSYEELASPPDRSGYLWGNPGLACAALIAQEFHKNGWACQPGSMLQLEDLPIHVFTLDGDEEVTLAEHWLIRTQTEQLTKRGIMSFLCVRGKGAMQLARFHALAQPVDDEPGCALQGHWNQSIDAPVRRPSASGPKVGLVDQMPEKTKYVEPKSQPLPPREAPLSAPPQKQTPPPEDAVEETPEPEPAAEETPEPEPVAEETSEAAPQEAEAAPAEEEMDPELAALLKQLE